MHENRANMHEKTRKIKIKIRKISKKSRLYWRFFISGSLSVTGVPGACQTGEKRQMSKLLINEKPLQVLPTLACAIGLNEAIVLQQIHYWLGNSRHVQGGFRWIYNSIAEWQAQFPFWSESTVKRALASLESKGLVIVANYNNDQRDRTKWYRIDYMALETVEKQSDSTSGEDSQNESVQDADTAECNLSDCTRALGQNDLLRRVSMTQPLPENTTRDYYRENKPSVVSLVKKPQARSTTRFDPLTEKPRNVSDEIWLDWISHRREIKQPLTPTSCRRIRSMLEKHTRPDAVITLSIERGWRGLFPEKITEPTGNALNTSGLNEAQRRELAMYEFLEGR